MSMLRRADSRCYDLFKLLSSTGNSGRCVHIHRLNESESPKPSSLASDRNTVMPQARSNRKNGGGGAGAGSQDVVSTAGGRNVSIPKVTAAKLFETARTELPVLTGLVEEIWSFPPQLRTDAFNVFYGHLQTPVEQQLCEKEEPYKWIMDSLLGIVKLGCAYFERDAAHKQRFVKCWPHIFKWLKALLNVRHIFDAQNQYSSLAGDAFGICLAVNRVAFKDDELFELAIRIWIGVRTSDDGVRYMARPLLSYLTTLEKCTPGDAQRLGRALAACDSGAYDLVDTTVSRLYHTISPMNISNVIQLVQLMASLVALRQQPFVSASFDSSVARCFALVLGALLADPEPSADHKNAVCLSLVIINGCLLYQTVSFALVLVERRILAPLLLLASSHSRVQGVSDANTSFLCSEILEQLRLSLFYNDLASESRRALEGLYASKLDVTDMLKRAPRRFRETWKSFEAVLLEQMVTLHLFEGGYAAEQGVCSNTTCRVLMLREDFKKCAGCAFALYCSTSCQKADWCSHKNGCKDMNDYILNVIQDPCNRFPRKMTSLHINRLIDPIKSLASRNGVPLCDMAVRINCLDFPFKVEIFDFHELLEENKERNQHLILVAKEMHRQSEEDQRDWMIVILRSAMMEFPFIMYLDELWTRSVSDALLPEDTKARDESELVMFADAKGNALSCGKMDALRAGVQLAKKYAEDAGETVWSQDFLYRATDDVLEDFEEELASFECPSAAGSDEE